MMSWRRLAAASLLAAAVPAVMLWVSVWACGPDFEPELFVSANHPEKPATFAEGHLGILQSTYYHADLVVAYRLLSGGKLSDTEKASYTSDAQATVQDRDMWSGSAVDWLKARQTVGDIVVDRTQPQSFTFEQQRAFKTTANAASVEIDFELNCADAAFTMAIDTLHQRQNRWGTNSRELVEWAHGQDAVFSNCSKAGSMPDPANPEWPLLLRQDRAYQIAAANFYSGNYDSAIAGFVAIGKDKASPWNAWGEYLAARAEVRKAASTTKPAEYNEMANFDMDILKAAEARLLKIGKESQDTGIRNAAAAELGFVEVRLQPGKHLDQAAEALAGPKPDPQFNQDLADLDYLMDRKVAGASDLAQWIQAMQGAVPVKPGAGTPNPLQLWQRKSTLPWMVAALAHTPAPDQAGPLLDAAAKIQPDSPGYETVNYYRAERLLDTGRQSDARTLLSAMLARMGPDTVPSTRNSFLSARLPTARNLTEFLADAPRTTIASESESADLAHCDVQSSEARMQPAGTGNCGPLQFDADSAGYINTQMPLALLLQAAESTALPQHLREAVAEMAWVRALGLDDAVALARMAKLLPAPMRQTAGTSDGFPATLALLRAPGVRPFLDQGVQRSASYSELDHFRDNWWCGRWTDGTTKNQGPPPIVLPPLAFLTSAQRQQEAAEAARINALPQGLVWVGQRAIAYVKAHPTDKDAPETLALVVQATRWGCAEYNSPDAQKAVSKEAFEMLHHTYPKSPWALKTKYYY